jgi:hypothetical protein
MDARAGEPKAHCEEYECQEHHERGRQMSRYESRHAVALRNIRATKLRPQDLAPGSQLTEHANGVDLGEEPTSRMSGHAECSSVSTHRPTPS